VTGASNRRIILLIVAGVAIGELLLLYGTISPCGIVRAQVRQEAEREGGFGVIATALPDGVIDSFIASRYGTLSPASCLAIALTGSPLRSTPARRQTSASAAPRSNQGKATGAMPDAVVMKQAALQTKAAIMDCRKRRLSGELKTYAASAGCSNPKIMDAYQQANYPYLDLISLITSKRLELAEQIDGGKLTEAEAGLNFAQFMVGVVDEERQREKGLR
jgi:hypothetical protein